MNNDFDPHFNRVEKIQGKIMRLGIVVALLAVALKLVLIGGVAYVAWHFISKYW